MYNNTLLRKEKHFCRYCLQAFNSKETLKHHIKDFFKINGKQEIAMATIGVYVKFKNYEKKVTIYDS